MTESARSAYPQGLRTWIDGTLFADPAQALVPAADHGLVAGDGVFEVLKVTELGAFAITRHLARLERSAERMGLPAPDLGHVRLGIDEVLADLSDWEIPHGRLRITYTDGIGPLASYRTADRPLVVVSAEPSPVPEAAGGIVTLPWTRNVNGAMTGIKTTSYGENVRGLMYAKARNAGEGIFVNTDGLLCEGTGTNIFCVFDEQIVTPPISTGALDGVTRALVLEWFGGEERNLTLAEAKGADEVFLTSTTRDVQAVNDWDQLTWQAPGPVATRLRAEFRQRAVEDPDP
ncbi:aminotransferase class IV [Granulicoccus sp. GXG6511]|uniref:aminotransferase class IV n=1 Tax=Granulicoccus sp. GXG6511 TaxID=3381351 RepID=UPI003D7E120F